MFGASQTRPLRYWRASLKMSSKKNNSTLAGIDVSKDRSCIFWGVGSFKCLGRRSFTRLIYGSGTWYHVFAKQENEDLQRKHTNPVWFFTRFLYMRRDHHVRSKQFNTSEESLNQVFCEPSGNTRLNNAPAPVPYINERDTTAAPPRAKARLKLSAKWRI